MMHVLAYLASPMADDLNKAVARLQHVTHEPWTVDWQRFGLVCRHGVLVNHWHVLAGSIVALTGIVASRHAEVDSSRTQRRECSQRRTGFLFWTKRKMGALG